MINPNAKYPLSRLMIYIIIILVMDIVLALAVKEVITNNISSIEGSADVISADVVELYDDLSSFKHETYQLVFFNGTSRDQDLIKYRSSMMSLKADIDFINRSIEKPIDLDNSIDTIESFVILSDGESTNAMFNQIEEEFDKIESVLLAEMTQLLSIRTINNSVSNVEGGLALTITSMVHIFMIIQMIIVTVIFILRHRAYLKSNINSLGSETLCGRIVVEEASNRVKAINNNALSILGVAKKDIMDQHYHDYFTTPNEEDLVTSKYTFTSSDMIESALVNNKGELVPVVKLIKTMNLDNTKYRIINFLDISFLKDEIKKRKQLESEVLHNNKLESIGTLAAGIAHEINTPVQFVGNNIDFLMNSYEMYTKVLDSYTEILRDELGHDERIGIINKKYQLDFMAEEIPIAIEQSREGINRITKIVGAMKDFSHIGSTKFVYEDINRSIESTVTISKNEWKYIADIQLDLDPTLPEVQCDIGDIKQVVLNMIINASHAIKDKFHGQMGRITIKTYTKNQDAFIEVGDNGDGIPRDIQDKIFNPFFTTKDVGIGTGQGLAISHQIVVKKHNGQLTFTSERGVGTTFIIQIPIDQGGE